MATLASLISSLTLKASIEESEGFTSDDLTTFLEEALQEHNGAMTIDSLPHRESLPVVTLAWANLCLVRASRFAKEANVNGASGIGADFDTPYRKCISLSKELRKKYAELCSSLDLDGGDTPEVTTLLAMDSVVDTSIPYQDVKLPSLLLSLADGESLTTGTTWILNWVMDSFTTFLKYRLYMIQGDDPIRQTWNYAPEDDAVNEVNNSATLLAEYTNINTKAAKLTGIDKTLTHRFLLVCENTGGALQYSNELVLTPPA